MIKQIIIPAALLGSIGAAALLAIRPYKARRKIMLNIFKQRYIAHRGLFKNPELPENSIKAFLEAVKNNYGIELDIQLTKDDKLVVFHDDTLDRICSRSQSLSDLTYDELQRLSLCGTDEHIPLFTDVLKAVNARVPLIIEIKPWGRFWRTGALTAKALKKYKGSFVIESFNPLVLFYFRINRPEILRGQLSTDFKKDGDTHPRLIQFILSNMLLNFISKPDFIAYNHKYTDRLAFKICTRLYKSLNVAWTIKNKSELSHAKKTFELYIFDSFLP